MASDVCDQVKTTLGVYIRARYPYVLVVSYEERRVRRILAELSASLGKRFATWTATEGLTAHLVDEKGEVTEQSLGDATVDFGEAMAKVEANTEKKDGSTPTVWLFHDTHKPFAAGSQNNNDATNYRKARDLFPRLKESKDTVFFLQPNSELPPELKKAVVIFDMPLPGTVELERVLKSVVASAHAANPGVVKALEKYPKAKVEEVLRAGLGLTEDAFENVVAKSIVKHKELNAREIVAEKEQVIRSSGKLEFFQSVEGLDAVGGLDVVKEDIKMWALGFTDAAKKFGVEPVKGFLSCGPPGTGKTLVSKAAACYLNVPLLVVNSDAILSKWQGESEANMRDILKTAEAVAPCILFMDEIEKLLGGSDPSAGNSNSMIQVLGMLLTWLQERTAPVVFAATSNLPQVLRPELVSRFDEAYFVDLPKDEEREAILAIHIRKKGRDPSKFDLKALAASSAGFSGRELQRAVVKAVPAAFAEGSEVETRHVMAQMKSIKPVAETRAKDIQGMRDWAAQNAKPASSATTTRKSGAREVEF